MLELKCQHCGETFVAKRRDTKWCSKRCAESRRRRTLGLRTFVCGNCNTNFESTRKSAVYCSVKCNNSAYYQENKEVIKSNVLKRYWEDMEKSRKNKRDYRYKYPDRAREIGRLSKNKAAATNALAHVMHVMLQLKEDRNDQPE